MRPKTREAQACYQNNLNALSHCHSCEGPSAATVCQPGTRPGAPANRVTPSPQNLAGATPIPVLMARVEVQDDASNRVFGGMLWSWRRGCAASCARRETMSFPLSVPLTPPIHLLVPRRSILPRACCVLPQRCDEQMPPSECRCVRLVLGG